MRVRLLRATNYALITRPLVPVRMTFGILDREVLVDAGSARRRTSPNASANRSLAL